MKRILYIILIVIIVGAFAWTLIFLYQKSQEKPVTYTTQKPIITNIIKKTVATGTIEPRQEINLKPVVSGIISKIFVEAGDTVKEGQAIARIKVIPNTLSLNNAQSRLERANIALENITVEYNRNQKLLQNGVIAQADFLPIELQYKNAKQEVSSAKDNLQIIRDGMTKKAGSETNTLVKSTINGMVLDVPVKEGVSVIEANNFNEGTTVATIANMNDLIFDGKVDESEVGKLTPGMHITLHIGAIQGKTFPAVLEYIAPKGVVENGAVQFEIKAAVQQPKDNFIRAGYSANADIILDRADSVLAISESLLQYNNKNPYVEIKTGDQKFEKKAVILGISDGIHVQVLNGISKNDEIKVWNKPAGLGPEKG